MAITHWLSPQLQKSSVQKSDEKLTFGPPSSHQFSQEEEDADFSWVDKLGRWPRRTLWVVQLPRKLSNCWMPKDHLHLPAFFDCISAFPYCKSRKAGFKASLHPFTELQEVRWHEIFFPRGFLLLQEGFELWLSTLHNCYQSIQEHMIQTHICIVRFWPSPDGTGMKSSSLGVLCWRCFLVSSMDLSFYLSSIWSCVMMVNTRAEVNLSPARNHTFRMMRRHAGLLME